MKNKKHAFLLMAHNNIDILRLLIKQLDNPNVDIFLHIDKKSDILIDDIRDIDLKFSEVYVFKKNKVYWAHLSQVTCEIFLLKEALEKDNYIYYHLLSGSDMLIKPIDELIEFFNKNGSLEYVHFESNDISLKKAQWINNYYVFQKFIRKNKTAKVLNFIVLQLQYILRINRNKTNKIKFSTGSNWFSITNEFAEYVVKKLDFIHKTFKFTRSPDEFFIQTILMNSKFRNTLFYSKFDDNYKSILRYIDWDRGNPYNFTIEDYDEILKSNMFIARKITSLELGNKIFNYTNEMVNK